MPELTLYNVQARYSQSIILLVEMLMLLSLTGIAGAESEVRRQDHCTATDRFTIWKGMHDLVLRAWVIGLLVLLYILTMLICYNLLLCVYVSD